MIPKTQLIFGLTGTLPLARLAELIEPLLGVSLRQRSSSYFGGQYYRGGAPTLEEVYLHPNLAQLGAGGSMPPLAYPDAPDCAVILRIDSTTRSSDDLLATLNAALGAPLRLLRARAMGSGKGPTG